MSMSWALSGRYQQIPFAVSMSVTLLDLQSQLFHWSSPGAGSAGQQEAGTVPRLAVMCSLPLFCPHHELTISEACGVKQPLGIALASKTLEVAQEKLRAEIYDQVNTCNMLLYQVKQRSRAQEQLQRRLQQLQDVQMDDKQHQAQVVRTLESNIEKMRSKVRAGQKVTVLYLVVRDALRKQARHNLAGDFLSQLAQDPLVGHPWQAPDTAEVPGGTRTVPRRVQGEEAGAEETLKELEMKLDELKFHQPPDTTRELEEDLRMRLQWEEARLEQRRAQLLRSQETLLEFENGLDNLFIRLHGIPVPGQEHSGKAMGVHEKLQQCKQKLQYLVQRVADLPPSSHSEDDETFVKVRQLLEKTLMNDPQNQKVSLEDTDIRVKDDFDFADKQSGLVLTREDIKKQGLQLMESKKKSEK
ncbi:coiled-coil domain-containing protein 183-like [Ara ararauna]